jgi:hypothetical protein
MHRLQFLLDIWKRLTCHPLFLELRKRPTFTEILIFFRVVLELLDVICGKGDCESIRLRLCGFRFGALTVVKALPHLFHLFARESR